MKKIPKEMMRMRADYVAVQSAKAAADADGWIPHDGSAKRPKGVRKRDVVAIQCGLNHGNPLCGTHIARDVLWRRVTGYRISHRAPKKEKRTRVYGGMDCGILDPQFVSKKQAIAWAKQ